jgi:hypothetical protein
VSGEAADRHERFLAELIDGRTMPGSGNQFAGQLDARGDARRQPFAFALDGKCTLGASITLKLADWEKVIEQAHDERPGFGLRFYLDGTLRHTVDLIAIPAADFDELRTAATRWAEGQMS